MSYIYYTADSLFKYLQTHFLGTDIDFRWNDYIQTLSIESLVKNNIRYEEILRELKLPSNDEHAMFNSLYYISRSEELAKSFESINELSDSQIKLLNKNPEVKRLRRFLRNEINKYEKRIGN